MSRVLLAKGMHKGDVSIQATGRLAYRNASENDCAERTIAAGQSFIVPAKTVFETVNTGSETAEVHVTGFLPSGQRVKGEEKPANC